MDNVTKVSQPTIIKAAGDPPKRIEEYIGRVNSKTTAISIARMQSPPGWSEPAQTPEFDEYTIILKGSLRVTLSDTEHSVDAGQAIIVPRGNKVRYSTPEGAEYIAVCLPAFSPDSVHREE